MATYTGGIGWMFPLIKLAKKLKVIKDCHIPDELYKMFPLIKLAKKLKEHSRFAVGCGE